MNSQKIIGGALSALIFNVFALSTASAQTQPSNEVQVQKQGETDFSALDEGCMVDAKPSCQARFVCVGQAEILGKSQSAVITARRVASLKAKGELAALLGNQVKMNELMMM